MVAPKRRDPLVNARLKLAGLGASNKFKNLWYRCLALLNYKKQYCTTDVMFKFGILQCHLGIQKILPTRLLIITC